MKTARFTLIHAPSVKVDLEIAIDKYADDNAVYLMPGRSPRKTLYLRSVHTAEFERDREIARYGNVLKGLEYWRARALKKADLMPK